VAVGSSRFGLHGFRSIVALLGGGLSFSAIVLIFLTHLLLDKRSFVNFWAYQVIKSNNIPWLKVIIDQS